MKTTVIIPCYNEAERFQEEPFLSFCHQHPKIYLLFVNDGSKDGTRKLLTELCSEMPESMAVKHLEKNSGKAEAVRQGLLEALDTESNDCVGYWDADLATPLELIPQFVAEFEKNSKLEMLMGARVKLLGRRIERRLGRHYLGRIFATVASGVLNLPVYDTQCGAKILRATPLLSEVLQKPFLSRWIFDVELILRLLKGHPEKGNEETWIWEWPLSEWRDVSGSKVKSIDFFKALWDLCRIKFCYHGTS